MSRHWLRRTLAAMLASVAASAAIPAASTTDTPAPVDDAAILRRAGTLSAEERRYLVYLYARLNKPKIAERLAKGILAETPADRQTLLVLASMYVEQRDAAATLRTARTFLAHYPGDHQGLYFLGAGHYLAKEYAEANRILGELKRMRFVGRKYPYETDLAASAYAAGDWFRAMLSYQELLRHHDLGDELRSEVRIVLDGIYREHLPRVDVTAAQVRLDLAHLWRYGASHGRHLSDRHWLEQRYARETVSLETAPGLRATRATRSEASANLTSVYDGEWRTDAWVGGSGEGFFGGGRLQHQFARQREIALEFAGNVRATDSLTLEALDGRQHHALLAVNWLLEADFALSLRGNVRQLRLAGQDFGRGHGIDITVDQTIWRQGPRVTAGYRGTVARFSLRNIDPNTPVPIADPAGGPAARDAVLANLVSRRINRHGAGFLVTDNLADAWVYRLTAGVDYDFELATTAWNGALALTFFPRKSIELTAEAGYTSSASASNAGSAATLLNFFIRTYY